MRQAVQILSLHALVVFTEAASAAQAHAQAQAPAQAHAQAQKQTRAQKEERLKEAAQRAQDVVAADRNTLETAITNLDELVAEVQHAGRNSSQVKSEAKALAHKVQNQASDAHKQDLQQAIDLYEKSLSTLKSTDPTSNWKDAEKSARANAEKVDEVQREEEKDGRQLLHQKRHETSHQVENAWHEADHAARVMLRDRYHLQDAQRRAGTKEREYERDEEKNEEFAERTQDYASDQKDNADDAVQNFFEEAEDHLYEIQREGHRNDHHRRHQEIKDAVKNLRQARREAMEATKQEEKKEREAKEVQASHENHAQTSLELLAIPDASEFCLYSIAGASLGLLAFLMVRLQTRRIQINEQMLG